MIWYVNLHQKLVKFERAHFKTLEDALIPSFARK